MFFLSEALKALEFWMNESLLKCLANGSKPIPSIFVHVNSFTLRNPLGSLFSAGRMLCSSWFLRLANFATGDQKQVKTCDNKYWGARRIQRSPDKTLDISTTQTRGKTAIESLWIRIELEFDAYILLERAFPTKYSV